MSYAVFLAFLLLVALLGLRGWRLLDHYRDKSVRKDLMGLPRPKPGHFSRDMVSALPEAARRYFQYTIAEGTSLDPVLDIEMVGQIGFGNLQKPNYQSMRARQILAPPYGLVWQLKSGLISGSDGCTPETSWTRFWLLGFIPVVRVGKNSNHHRSAFGRVVAEAAFWCPASLLPADHIVWHPIDANAAAVTITMGAFTQRFTIHVEQDGRPTAVVLQRWSNENPERVFREQPFGGTLSEFKSFGGYRLPTHVEGGNHFGTADYFPFYKADITQVRFLKTGTSTGRHPRFL